MFSVLWFCFLRYVHSKVWFRISPIQTIRLICFARGAKRVSPDTRFNRKAKMIGLWTGVKSRCIMKQRYWAGEDFALHET